MNFLIKIRYNARQTILYSFNEIDNAWKHL